MASHKRLLRKKMAGLKEIKRRLDSVKNTKKITYAMKLVAAAKLRKAQEAVTRSRDYSNSLNDLMNNLIQQIDTSEFEHPLLTPHPEVKKVRLLVIGGSRGLCGGYNTNVNRKVESVFKSYTESGKSLPESVILAKKPAEYYRRTQKPYLISHENLPEDANLWPIDEVCRDLESSYTAGEVDEVYMIYTKFKSALSMTVMLEKILPMEPPRAAEGAETGTSGVTIFEPSVEDVFGELVPRLLRTKVRQACLDAKASEYGSRMTAMEAATKNAGQLIHSLQLKYNKLRQSRITSELLDILGGAEAIS